MTAEVKFCKDCKHSKVLYCSPLHLFCVSPNLSKSIVTAEVQVRSCEGLRHCQDKCGKEANWFEPKPQKLGFFDFIKRLVH